MRKSVIFLFICLSSIAGAQDMDLKSLKLALAQRAVVVAENGPSVEYDLDGVHIYLIADESANRMRLVAGIVEESKVDANDLKKMMEANFDRALDAKYALSNGVLWSVYAHPLKELERDQLVDALYQVKNLVNNYGTTYNSTDFIFGSDN